MSAAAPPICPSCDAGDPCNAAPRPMRAGNKWYCRACSESWHAAPAPFRPAMNWQERARRAEALLQEMTIAAANLLHHDNAGNRLRLRNSVALSDAHRADLDTLEQEAAR